MLQIIGFSDGMHRNGRVGDAKPNEWAKFNGFTGDPERTLSSAGNLHLKWANGETGVRVEFYGLACAHYCLEPGSLHDKELDVHGDLLDRLLQFYLQTAKRE